MIAVVIAALLWGTTGTAATALPDTVSPLATGAATMAIGGLLLALTAPRQVQAVMTTGRSAWAVLTPGALCVGIYPLAFYTSMSLAGVAIGNVVSLGTAPVFAALLERLLDPAHRRRRLQPRWIAAAAVSIAGVVVLALFGHGPQTGTHSGVASGAEGAQSSHLLVGIACGALAGLTYAGYTYTAGRLMTDGASSRGAMGAQFGLGAVLLWPVVIATGGPLQASSPSAASANLPSGLAALVGTPDPWQVIAYLALGPMFVAYLLFGRGLRTIPSSQATTLTLIEPFVATLLAVAVLGERLTIPGWVGLGMVLTGVVAVAVTTRRPASPPHPSGTTPTSTAASTSTI